MTVVAFRSGVMASDGRMTDETSIFSNKVTKVYRLKDGSLLGLAGDAAYQDILELFNKKGLTIRKLANLQIDFSGIWAKQDGTVWTVEVSAPKDKDQDRWTALLFEVKESFLAIGSGAPYALGAMERGASAEQAVKVAIKYDSACGGDVQKFRLNDTD